MKKLIYLFLAITIISCGADDGNNTSFSGNWEGTFNIPAGQFAPDGDFGTITFEAEEFDNVTYFTRGTIISDVYGEYEFGAFTGGYIEKNESDQWEYSGSALFLSSLPGEIYFFDGIIQNNSVEGVVTPTHAPNGTFSISKN
ncbi:hypothetical protein N9C25_07365, partial [Saprospiraceae bacterium]|nr:hypothetical protein [Saprospiraceae bacterium]